MNISRLASTLTFAIFLVFFGCKEQPIENEEINQYQLSLAQWSLHKELHEGRLDNFDFIRIADSLNFEGVEFVNQFFMDRAGDSIFLTQLKDTLLVYNITPLLIMIDGEGDLANPNIEESEIAITNHYKWIDAAQYLGCHSIRVNLFGDGDSISVTKAAINSLKKMCSYASTKNINILVENHGGLSSNGDWLSSVMDSVRMPNCGTLPDFGNFCLKWENGGRWGSNCLEAYPIYKGIEELMPYAFGVSAKSYEFDAKGNEVNIDYDKMLSIIKKSNYEGFIGVEYEGTGLSSIEGIVATKNLLIKSFSKES